MFDFSSSDLKAIAQPERILVVFVDIGRLSGVGNSIHMTDAGKTTSFYDSETKRWTEYLASGSLLNIRPPESVALASGRFTTEVDILDVGATAFSYFRGLRLKGDEELRIRAAVGTAYFQVFYGQVTSVGFQWSEDNGPVTTFKAVQAITKPEETRGWFATDDSQQSREDGDTSLAKIARIPPNNWGAKET